jgi:hypothetical protein
MNVCQYAEYIKFVDRTSFEIVKSFNLIHYQNLLKFEMVHPYNVQKSILHYSSVPIGKNNIYHLSRHML